MPGESDRIPEESEINVYDSLDERWAVGHLLGLGRDEAREQFEDNIYGACESLMHIGPVACAYYGVAAMEAAWNCVYDGDEGEALQYVLSVLSARFEHSGWDVGDQPGFTDAVLEHCARVEREWDSLRVGDLEQDMRTGYRDLREKLAGP